MPPLFCLIPDLQLGKSKNALWLRLIRSYKIPQIQNRNEDYSQELVFHDIEGSRIHGSIQKASISAFDGVLKEENVYALMDFIVTNNTMRSKTTDCPFKIILFKQTKAVELLEDSFPSFMLNLKSFDEVTVMETNPESTLFDVMGIVTKSFSPIEKEINGKTAKLMDIVIEDLEKKNTKVHNVGELCMN